MKVSQLRDLTRKFAAGGLSEDDYRRERSKLIEGIVNGDVQPKYREIHPAEPGKQNSAGKRRRLLAIGGALVLLALLAAAVIVQVMTPDMNAGAETADGNATAQAEPGVILLREFLRQNNWDDAGLEGLERDWSSLSGFEREAARRSHLYRRLKAQTESRIKEYEALAVDNPQALLQAARLRMFAERLDFNPGT